MEQLTNTEMFDRNIRVQCLKLVMENGSNLDRKGPVEKAKDLYAWITETTEVKKAAEASDDSEEQFGQPFGIPSKGDLKGSGKVTKK